MVFIRHTMLLCPATPVGILKLQGLFKLFTQRDFTQTLMEGVSVCWHFWAVEHLMCQVINEQKSSCLSWLQPTTNDLW